VIGGPPRRGAEIARIGSDDVLVATDFALAYAGRRARPPVQARNAGQVPQPAQSRSQRVPVTADPEQPRGSLSLRLC
jgi:hypothetical protein